MVVVAKCLILVVCGAVLMSKKRISIRGIVMMMDDQILVGGGAGGMN